MCKSITANNGFIGLHRHTHLQANRAAYLVNIACVDVGMKAEAAVGFQNHHHFLDGGVPGPFADAIDGAFYLPRAVLKSRYRVGSCQAEVVMAMYRYNSFIDILYIVL